MQAVEYGLNQFKLVAHLRHQPLYLQALYVSVSQLVQGMCRQLENSLQRLSHCSNLDVHTDILTAQDVLENARESFKVQTAPLASEKTTMI